MAIGPSNSDFSISRVRNARKRLKRSVAQYCNIPVTGNMESSDDFRALRATSAWKTLYTWNHFTQLQVAMICQRGKQQKYHRKQNYLLCRNKKEIKKAIPGRGFGWFRSVECMMCMHVCRERSETNSAQIVRCKLKLHYFCEALCLPLDLGWDFGPCAW